MRTEPKSAVSVSVPRSLVVMSPERSADACGAKFANPFACSQPNLQSRAENALFAALGDFPQCRRTAQPHVPARVFTLQILQGTNHIGQRFVRRNTGSPWCSQF